MTKKVVSGICTFLPFILLVVYIVWFIFSIMSFTTSVTEYEVGPGSMDPIGEIMPMMMTFMSIYLVYFLMWIVGIGLMIFYLIDIARNNRVDKKMSIVWTVLMMMAGWIAMPVYWVMYIILDKPGQYDKSEAVAAVEEGL